MRFLRQIAVSLLITALLLAGSAASAQLAKSSWPSFQGDERNSGCTRIVGTDNNQIGWTCLGYGGLEGSTLAVGQDGTVYAATRGGITAVKPDGALRWHFTGGPCNGGPAIGRDGTIYYGSMWGRLYALNPSGSVKWGYMFSGGIERSSPTIDNKNNVYFATTAGFLFSFQGDTGDFNWGIYIGPSYSSPAIGNNNVIYATTTLGYLHAVNRKGELLWSVYLGETGTASPAVALNGTIYIGTSGPNASLNAVSHKGEILRSLPIPGGINGAPAVGQHRIYFIAHDERLHAVHPTAGPIWSFEAAGIVSARMSSPVVDCGGTIYYVGRAANYDAYLIAINPNGTERWRTRLPYGFVCPPAMGNSGELYTNGSAINRIGL